MSKQHIRPQAKHLFMQHLTLDEIAELLPVSKTTLCEWSNRYRWKEQRDRFDSDPETLSFDLRQKLANDVGQLKIGEDGTYGVDWDSMCKAATTIEKFGGVDDPVAIAVKDMDRFSRFVKAQGWPQEKVTYIFEAIQAYLDQIGEEAF